MLRLPSLALLVLLLQASGCATAGKPVAPPYEGYFGTFPNGMRLLVYGLRDSGAVTTLHVSYAVGAAEEPAGQEGVRELAMRLSALTRSEGEGSPMLAERFAASRTVAGAGLSPDESFFSSFNRTLQLPRLLELEAMRMRAPLAHVTEAEFVAERDALAEALHEQAAAPIPLDLVRGALFAGHPYGRQLPGSESAVRALTLEAVQAWARRHYTPDRAVLVVMGSVPPKEVAAAVTAAFGGLAGGLRRLPARSAPPPLPRVLPQGSVVRQASPVAHPQLWLVWQLPGNAADKFAEASMMSECLRRDVLPFLQYRMRRPGAPAAQVGMWGAEGVTLLYLVLPLEPGEDTGPLLARVEDRLSFSWGEMAGESTAQELRELRLRMAQQEVRLLSPPLLALYLRMTGRADFHGGWPRRVRELPLSSIRGFAREYLRVERANLLLLEPAKEAASAAASGP